MFITRAHGARQEMADAKAEISEKHDMLEKTTPLEAVEDEDGWSRCNVVAMASHLGANRWKPRQKRD